MAGVNVTAIYPKAVAAHWGIAAPWIERAVEHGRCRFTLDSIREDLIEGRKTLWLVSIGETLVAAIVTAVTAFPNKRVCTILLCGGGEVDEWVGRALDTLEEYARWRDCAEIEIIGRPGWRRKCAGYDHAGEWLVKELAVTQ